MTGWSTLRASLPGGANMLTIQGWLLEQIRAGHFFLKWGEITVERGEVLATFEVSSPIELGEPGDSVIPAMSANTAQRAADIIGVRLVTPQLMDLAAATWPLIDFQDLWVLPGEKVGDLSLKHMEDLSNTIHAELGESGGPWVAGKQWPLYGWYRTPQILTGGARTRVNYGGHTKIAAGASGNPWRSEALPEVLRVWQPPGGRGTNWHDGAHVDGSQLGAMFVERDVKVEIAGEVYAYDFDEIAESPELSTLANKHGVFPPRLPLEGGAPPGDEDEHPIPGPAPSSSAGIIRTAGPVVVAVGLLAVLLWRL